MKIYIVKDIHGNNPTLNIRFDKFGKVRIFSKKELEFSPFTWGEMKKVSIPRLKKDGTVKKKPGKKPIVTPPPAVAEVPLSGVSVAEKAEAMIAEVKDLPEDDIVNVGDSIEFTLNGEASVGQITKEYPDLQELEIMMKGGVKMVIPAAWFVRKL